MIAAKMARSESIAHTDGLIDQGEIISKHLPIINKMIIDATTFGEYSILYNPKELGRRERVLIANILI